MLMFLLIKKDTCCLLDTGWCVNEFYSSLCKCMIQFAIG